MLRTLRLLQRLDSWFLRLYRQDPERHRREQSLRMELLRRLLVAAGAGAVLYLALGLAGVVSGRFFPFDALELLLAVAVCAWLLRRGHTASALVLPLVVFSHTASSIIAAYGISSPAPALFLPTILVCGLLVGGYFLGTWTVICCILVWFLSWAIRVSESADFSRPVLIWWVLFASVGWLVQLFSNHLERLLQLERMQKHTVLRTVGLLASDPHLEGLLNRTLELVREQLGARSVTLWRLDGMGEFLWCAASVGTTEEPAQVALASLPIWKSLAEGRRAVPLTFARSDPRLTGVTSGAGQVVVVPLTVSSALVGMLVAAGDRTPDYVEEWVDLAEALALHLSLVLEIVGLAERDRHAMIVEERNRMARDIHDTLAQGFTGIVVQLNAAGEMLSTDRERARAHIATAQELARISLQEARRSVWALRPANEESESLATLLERSARTLTVGTETEISMEASGEMRGLGIEAERDVLRIGQEAVANALRHAGCRRITLRLIQGKGTLRLDIEDDGKGGILLETDPARVGGLGLVGMQERAVRVGGRLEIDSPKGGPTRITLVIPGK